MEIIMFYVLELNLRIKKILEMDNQISSAIFLQPYLKYHVLTYLIKHNNFGLQYICFIFYCLKNLLINTFLIYFFR